MGFWDWAATDNNLVGVVVALIAGAVAIVWIIRTYE